MNDHHRPLCEQLMVLLLTDDGKPVAATTTGYLLAGALLADLVVRGRVDLAGPGETVPAGGVLVRSPMPTGDDLLDDALERVRRREGGRPSSVIRPLSKGTRSAVLERLTAAGIVGVSSRRVLGLFPVRSWPLVHPGHAARARRAVQAVVESTGPARPRDRHADLPAAGRRCVAQGAAHHRPEGANAAGAAPGPGQLGRVGNPKGVAGHAGRRCRAGGSARFPRVMNSRAGPERLSGAVAIPRRTTARREMNGPCRAGVEAIELTRGPDKPGNSRVEVVVSGVETSWRRASAVGLWGGGEAPA